MFCEDVRREGEYTMFTQEQELSLYLPPARTLAAKAFGRVWPDAALWAIECLTAAWISSYGQWSASAS